MPKVEWYKTTLGWTSHYRTDIPISTLSEKGEVVFHQLIYINIYWAIVRHIDVKIVVSNSGYPQKQKDLEHIQERLNRLVEANLLYKIQSKTSCGTFEGSAFLPIDKMFSLDAFLDQSIQIARGIIQALGIDSTKHDEALSKFHIWYDDLVWHNKQWMSRSQYLRAQHNLPIIRGWEE